MYQIVDNVPVWGEPLQDAVNQAVTVGKRAEAVALMADHHVGYAMPIGGVAAYGEHISPSGVGYDISCLVEGTLVTTAQGQRMPIEQIIGVGDLLGNDNGNIVNVGAALRLVPKQVEKTIALTLQSGDTLRLTEDHLLLTPTGWSMAGKLSIGEPVAVSSYIGVADEQLRRHPLDYRIVRLFGYAVGDGHLSKEKYRVSFYTSQDKDVEHILQDLYALGYDNASCHRRIRPNGSIENQIYCNSKQFHTMFAEWGRLPSVANWSYDRLSWLLDLPNHLKAAWLAGLFSAEMAAPVTRNGKLLGGAVMKQGGLNPLPLLHIVKALLHSIGFDSEIYPSGQPYKGRQIYQILIAGGQQQTIKAWRQIGFPYARYKQQKAAAAMSLIWQRAEVVAERTRAVELCRTLRQSGVGVYDLAQAVSTELKINFSHSMALKAIYEDRGLPRVPSDLVIEPQVDNEFVWSSVQSSREIHERVMVYDIPLAHDAHNFIANGVVAHNCGNKAVLLDAPASEVRPFIKEIMDDVWRQISFGVGRKNAEEVEHELFEDDPAWDIPEVRKHKKLAREQLGTVGSGNHYVDLFVDEQERVWIGVHFGSRGLGHHLASYYIKAGGGRDGMNVEPVLLPIASPLGKEYIAAMQLAGRYAYAGRDWVCEKVATIIGAKIVDEIHNHHNFCIAEDQLVPTPSGPKRVDCIKSGDVIYTIDMEGGLKETTVTDHWCTGTKPIYTIRTANRQIKVSAEHPILTVETQSYLHPQRLWHRKATGELVWKCAGEITRGDIIVCAEGYYQHTQTIGVDTARLVGAFLGDGWVRHTGTDIQGYTVGLAIGAENETHTEAYRQLLSSVLPDAIWKNNVPGAYGLTCSSVDVWHTLDAMAITAKSKIREIPDYAFSLLQQEKLALLSGYFDADGSVANHNTSNHGRGTIASVSKDLVYGLRELAIGCGFQITPVRKELQQTNFGPCTVYRCVLSADSVSKLDLWHETKKLNARKTIYQRSSGLMPRKLGYIKLPAGLFAQRVRSVSISEPETVYDLTVADDSHAFICEGIVVHNCWRENHSGHDLWVVRKGATPAFPGQRSFVGGTMAEPAVILEGVDSEEAKKALYSTVHGAGRVMSRTRAAGKKRWKNGKLETISQGEISDKMMMNWVRKAGVELRGGGVDESPHCYKRLDEVLQYHKDSIRILHTLTPIGVAMAGEHEFDPYKD